VTLDRDVVIIGAPRSGTNMLRDVITGVPGLATWPCDEINLLWRHGNRAHPSDELGPANASDDVCAYLRRQFDRIRERYDARSVVEKTCANSLRVGFVRRVKPDARYILITRDGLDAATSAMARWHAPLDFGYTAAKARFVPVGDLPYYATRFVAAAARPRRGSGQVRRWWGPRTHDAEQLMASRPLDEICLLQWRRCVDKARAGLAGLPDEQLHHVVYEEFVRHPEDELRRLLEFLGRPDDFEESLVSGVSSRSVGKGRASLSSDAAQRLAALGRPTLEALGYAAA